MDGGVGVAASSSRYWCYNCEHIINPVRIGSEMVQCPLCQGGFVEDVASSGVVDSESDPFSDFLGTATATAGGGGGGSESDRALSLWAPILLGMMSNPRRRRRLRRRLELEDEEDDENNNNNNQSQHGVESMDPRRRRRSSATILQLLQGIRAGMLSESENNNNRRRESSGDRENSILINPFDHSIILNGSSFNSENRNNNRIGSLGDYFVGPGLDLLLQHLAENDPNRYGTPPAQKEVVETMPIVKINDNLLQCSICLDDFEVGKEAKEMPCKHKFHSGCILPWLKLHSSCPVCRYQLPFDEPKVDNNNNNNNNAADMSGIVDDIDGINRRRFSMPLPWPLSSLFSSPGSSSSSSGPETSSHSSSHHTDNEN